MPMYLHFCNVAKSWRLNSTTSHLLPVLPAQELFDPANNLLQLVCKLCISRKCFLFSDLHTKLAFVPSHAWVSTLFCLHAVHQISQVSKKLNRFDFLCISSMKYFLPLYHCKNSSMFCCIHAPFKVKYAKLVLWTLAYLNAIGPDHGHLVKRLYMSNIVLLC